MFAFLSLYRKYLDSDTFSSFSGFYIKLSSGTKCWNDNLSAAIPLRARKSICADYLWALQQGHVQFMVTNPFCVYWQPLSLQAKDIMSSISWWCLFVLSRSFPIDWNQVDLQVLVIWCHCQPIVRCKWF